MFNKVIQWRNHVWITFHGVEMFIAKSGLEDYETFITMNFGTLWAMGTISTGTFIEQNRVRYKRGFKIAQANLANVPLLGNKDVLFFRTTPLLRLPSIIWPFLFLMLLHINSITLSEKVSKENLTVNFTQLLSLFFKLVFVFLIFLIFKLL